MKCQKKDSPWLTSSQAAAYLGVSRQTLYNWEASGALIPDLRTVGNARRYRKDTLDMWKQNQTKVG